MFKYITMAAVLLFAASAPAAAEVQTASPGAFVLRAETVLAAPAAQTWRAVPHIEQWWSPAHTYSGDASNLRLDLRAGGCWCERWGRGQSVEHGRVLLVMERDGVRTMRVLGALGPLQEMGVSGVLTLTVAPEGNSTKLSMTYRVSGDPGLNLEHLAPLVDQVLMEQFARLARFAQTGAPA